MSNRERADSGEFTETVTHSRVLDVFKSVDGPTITSTDVADTLGCSDETARRKLKELHEKGIVGRRKTGRTVLWWITEDRDEQFNPVDPDDPIFTDRPSFSTGRSDLSESVDDVLYDSDA